MTEKEAKMMEQKLKEYTNLNDKIEELKENISILDNDIFELRETEFDERMKIHTKELREKVREALKRVFEEEINRLEEERNTL